jgi:hypothetical protein
LAILLSNTSKPIAFLKCFKTNMRKPHPVPVSCRAPSFRPFSSCQPTKAGESTNAHSPDSAPHLSAELPDGQAGGPCRQSRRLIPQLMQAQTN